MSTLRAAIILALSVSTGLVSAGPVPAQRPPCIEAPGVNEACPAWDADYDSPDPDCTEDVARKVVGPDGVYIAATRTCNGFDILVVAFGLDGTRRWVATYDGQERNRDQAYDLALSPDGRHLYVVGVEDVGGNDIIFDWVTVALDAATGQREWVANYAGSAGDDDEAWTTAVSPDGERVYVTGYERWRESEEKAGMDTLTVAYDAETGEQLWKIRFDGDPHRIDLPRAIGVSEDGVVVTGSSVDPFASQDIQTVAYRDDRKAGRAVELWRAGYDGGDWDQVMVPCMTRRIQFCMGLMGSVAVTDDTVAIAAASYVDPTTDDSVWTTIAYELETGGRRWLRKHGDPTLQNKPNAIAASPDGETIYVTGYTNDELLWDGVGDAAAVAYDTHTGELRWQTNYALPAVDDASGFALAVSEETIYVSGSIEFWPTDNMRCDVLTLAYDAETGSQEWVARYNRYSTTPTGVGDFDNGHWAALAADGELLIVGGGFARNFRVQEQGDFWDLGVLAYDV